MHKRVLEEGSTPPTFGASQRAVAGLQHSQRVLRSRVSLPSELPSWRPSARLDPVERYGRFEILGRIGRGGMAEILLARERSLAGGARYLVIKRILPEVREFDEMLNMFLDEARVVMGLSHPHLCQIFEVGEQEGAWFIAMEWVNGVTLHQLARRALELSRVDYAIIARVIAACAEALHYAHTARDAEGQLMNLVHRDVSPHNIMVAYDGRVKLLDFGIAKSATTTHRTEAGVVKGKICYMAPEQWLSQPVDARTDVFALGACLYEALSGRVAFKRENQLEVMRAVLAGEVTPLRELAPDVPSELVELTERALQPKAELRFQSAREMGEALERFAAHAVEPVTSARVARYTRILFETEVMLGPVLERSAYGAVLAPNLLLLPPLPASLLGAPKPSSALGSLPELPLDSLPSLALSSAANDLLRSWPAEGAFDAEGATVAAPIDVEQASRSPSVPASEEREVLFSEAPTRLAIPSLRTHGSGEAPRPLARTLSIGVGRRVRRVALGSALFIVLFASLWLRVSPAPPVRPLAPQLDEAGLRAAAFPTPTFTVLPPSAPLTSSPERALAGAKRPDTLGLLSINTRPWSTVYIGSRLLGSTPLAEVTVPRGALVLKLVDRDGRVHVRRLPASAARARAVYFEF